MAQKTTGKNAGRGRQDTPEARLEREEQENPSGHGTQVTPGQQREIARTSKPPAPKETANEFDEATLEELKGGDEAS